VAVVHAPPDPAVRAGAAVTPFLRILTTAPRIHLDPHGPTVSVVIPTKNEEPNLRWLARHMPDHVAELVLVDGGSTDGTVETARALWPDVRVVEQTRRGKGNALACGFAAATGDIIVMIDADGSMDPGEIPYFVAALRDGADYAKGSRFALGGGSSDITALRALGNRRLNAATALVHGTAYSDLCYGYNAFWRHTLPALGLDAGTNAEGPAAARWGDGFEVETLINIRVHAAALKVTEVASFEHERLYGLSNLRTFRDGARVLRTIGLEKLLQRRAGRGVPGLVAPATRAPDAEEWQRRAAASTVPVKHVLVPPAPTAAPTAGGGVHLVDAARLLDDIVDSPDGRHSSGGPGHRPATAVGGPTADRPLEELQAVAG